MKFANMAMIRANKYLYLKFAACYGGYHEQNEQVQDAKSHPKKPIWGMGEKINNNN